MRRTNRLETLVLVAVTVAALSVPVPALAAPATDPPAPAAAAADRLVEQRPEFFRIGPHDTLTRGRVLPGARGLHYVPYERAYAGLPVRGGDFVVATDAEGHVLSVSINQKRELSVATRPRVSADSAVTASRGELKNVETTSAPRLVVLAEGVGRLAYETMVTGTREDAPSRLRVHVDAQTGKVIRAVDMVRQGIGHGFYHGRVAISTTRSATLYGMSDPHRPGVRCGGLDGRTYTDPDDDWGNGGGTDLVTACVDAMYAAQQGWDMLGNWLQRSGFDGYGRGFPMRVGYPDTNAYWQGFMAIFGHNVFGTRQATPTDVVMHELGHAIFQWTPGGTGGTNEAASLNESAGDIFGALTEAYIDSPLDPPDYLAGEEVNLTGTGPIRVMYDPAQLGDPGCWSPGIPGAEPHAGAGVQNHWFYLLAEGSAPPDGPRSPTCNGARVTGIGIQRAGAIFMETLNRKLDYWTHGDARRASLAAARDLFRPSCTEFRAVRGAWNAVAVPPHPDEPTTCP